MRLRIALAQAKVICSEADFSEVGLNKHVVDERIEVVLDEDRGKGNGDPNFDLSQQDITI